MSASPRLHLHCGWPKTGTKSLQAVLARNREMLDRAETVYPDRWGRQLVPGLPSDDSHNGFPGLFERFRSSEGVLAELEDLLDRCGGKDLVISCETFIVMLLDKRNRAAIPRFFEAIQEHVPVICIWTLRRFDDFAASFLLQLLSMSSGRGLVAPSIGVIGNIFGIMRDVEESVERALYIRYDPGGAHNVELLRAFGIRAEARDVLEQEIAESPRLHPSLTRKQAITLLNVDAISAKMGVALDRRALAALFGAGEFEFHGDGPAEPLDARQRKEFREEALRRARGSGIAEYVEFFEGEVENDEGRAAGPERLTGLEGGLDLLTDEDLERLADASVARGSDGCRVREPG